MSGFDFLFSFQSLLLGLAVARVATGFADMWRGRKDIVVGISPILLGLLSCCAVNRCQLGRRLTRPIDSIADGFEQSNATARNKTRAFE